MQDFSRKLVLGGPFWTFVIGIAMGHVIEAAYYVAVIAVFLVLAEALFGVTGRIARRVGLSDNRPVAGHR